MDLNTPLFAISGIGSSYAKRLAYLNLNTVSDLINHFPFRYEDFSNTTSVLESQEGERVTLIGEIWSIKNVYTRNRKVLTQAIFNDGTSPIDLTWFNQSYLTKSIQTGDKLQISGRVKRWKNKFSIVAPVWEKIGNQQVTINKPTLHTGRLVPVYSETAGLTSKWIRAKIADILPKVKSEVSDPLPEEIKNGMEELVSAVEKIHFPKSQEDVFRAQERLGFDELFYVQLATQKARAEWQDKPSVEPLKIQKKKLEEFIKSLPFKLTNAQKRVVEEITSDLQKTYPMNRLVQGEVGSGKTVVAAIIAYLTHLNKLRTLYMAPTEILAFQHFSTFTRLLESLGVKVGIYTGSRKFTKLKKTATVGNKKADSGQAGMTAVPDIIIGTHALLSEKLVTEDVGLVIIDEQQRFGVEQRSFLRGRAKVPHFLTMTATPIPRTVALTMYGDLDLSIINELPKGRKLVSTHVVPSKKRADAYKFIEKKVKENGDQVYIITPLIEESETLTSVKAAIVEFERLKTFVFPDLKLGLLHGRLKSKEKEEVLNKFKDKEIDILISTTVVEVGVDVSNATIMVIEGAERFGLAQLHQLRGRVGRGEKESFALLFPGNEDPQVVSRLKSLEKNHDGYTLAELDLKIRGAGEVFGRRQSGRFEFKIASFSDLSLIEKTRNTARDILSKDPTLDNYPKLKLKLSELTSGAMPD
jgi:ATP-dependent DNA helicase RecG